MMMKFPFNTHDTVVFAPYVTPQTSPHPRPINNNEQVHARERVQPNEAVGYDCRGCYRRTMGRHVDFIVA